ncbi:glycosyl hydrolase [Kitasatospora sp. NPDC004799]|uniref:glycosyl hydrolase n=1 Tax=Kitasatospora sp. NPDC004799 TaxID=3154460 RepID=UPI0033BAC08C
MTPTLDLQVDGLTPADEETADLYDGMHEDEFKVLAQHDAGERSLVLAFDTTATWGALHGEPNVAAFDVVRHRDQGSFSLRTSQHANLAFARKWLIERGCPSDALQLAWRRPGDELTARVEERIHRAGDRYEVVDQLAMDGEATEAWTIAVDRTAAELPARLFLEEFQPDRGTYTLREGAFPDVETAWRWTRTDLGPLPLVPEDRDPEFNRTRATLARSAAPSISAAAVMASAPAAAAVAQPDRRRSL